MYLEITNDLGDIVQLRKISNLSFSPEVDPTFSTIPIDMFTVDVVTDEPLRPHAPILLKDDTGALWADYTIKSAKNINDRQIRVEAYSDIGVLDNFILGAEYINKKAIDCIDDILKGLTKSGGSPMVDYVNNFGVLDVQDVTGFFPEQTCRERLQWICLAFGVIVQQSFCHGLIFSGGWNYSQSAESQYVNYTLIPIENTYWKPTIKEVEPMRFVEFASARNFTTTKPEAWNPESGTAENGTDWYWFKDSDTVTNPDVAQGNEIKYADVSMSWYYGQTTIFNYLRYMTYEITMDVIDNDGDYKPNTHVRVYVDENTVYFGVVNKCTYTFGQQAKATLTIQAHRQKATMISVSFVYRYSFTDEYGEHGITLGRRDYKMPVYARTAVDHPEIAVDVVGALVTYRPTTPSTYITGTEDIDEVIQYEKKVT